MSLRDGLNLLAQPPYNAVIARPQRGRGNLKAVIHRTFQPDDASQRLPRACGPRNDPMGERIATSACGLLAMTEKTEAQAQTIDHICHCEAP